MPPEVKLVVTTEELFDAIQGYYPEGELFVSSDEKSLIIDRLTIHFQDSSAEPGDLELPGPGAKIAYLDQDYARLHEWSQQGWRTAWLNRKGSLAPDTLPVQDVDLLSLEALSRIPFQLGKPTLSQCLAWWDAWDVPENIRRHVTAVAWCAYAMAVLMRNKGVDLDPVLAHRGGLLHDIDKIPTLNQQGAHGEMGADFLEEHGYHHTAAIVRGHIMHKILDPHADDRSWETKLVFFADKLLEGDRIVPFDVRLKALKERYPGYSEAMSRAESSVWKLSEKICSILSMPSHEILISTLIQLQNY